MDAGHDEVEVAEGEHRVREDADRAFAPARRSHDAGLSALCAQAWQSIGGARVWMQGRAGEVKSRKVWNGEGGLLERTSRTSRRWVDAGDCHAQGSGEPLRPALPDVDEEMPDEMRLNASEKVQVD